MDKFKTIPINEINNLEQINLIDIREPSEVASGMISGASNIPMMGIISNPQVFLNKQETYCIYCRSRKRSFEACTILSELGYNVVNLAGGISEYNI